MPITTVAGSPFSGKSRFVTEEIARREEAGELGLVRLSWTELYGAIVPGVQSSFRDDSLADTGAPRLASYVYEVITAAAVARELDGYVLTQSPRQAIALADRFDGPLLEVVAPETDIAARAEVHMRNLAGVVPRASRGAAIARCRKAALTYANERPALVGRAREVRRSGDGWKVGGPSRAFDRALWQRGLTPKGHEALAELVSLGNDEPTPSDVLAFLLKNRVEG